MISSYSLKDLIIYFLKIGTWGFGGPVALVGYMHRDLVDHKKWISEDDYKEGLALAQLAPGPLAAQLAIYIGYVHYRILGATLAGLAFVLPSFIMVLLIGYAYVSYGGLPWMQAIFYGVGAAVVGIIAVGSYKLTRKSIGNDKLLWIIFIALAAPTFIMEEENLWLILLAGVVVWFAKAPPKWLASGANGILPAILVQVQPVVTESKLWEIAWFFVKAGAFVFGSGLAIVPFLYGGVVKEYQWLNEQQFLDAVAVAMITPGPVVITVGFIGSCTFLYFNSIAVTATAINIVGISFKVLFAKTRTAPAIAPIAAAVTPSTKAFIAGCLPYFLKYGAGITVNK